MLTQLNARHRHPGLNKRELLIVSWFLYIYFYPGNKVSLCNHSGCPETFFVDQSGLKLIEIFMPLLPECRD